MMNTCARMADAKNMTRSCGRARVISDNLPENMFNLKRRILCHLSVLNLFSRPSRYEFVHHWLGAPSALRLYLVQKLECFLLFLWICEIGAAYKCAGISHGLQISQV